MTSSAPPPGWHDDPSGARALRWWDGSQWTEYIAARGYEALPADQFDQERKAARWARLAFVGTVFGAIGFGVIAGLLFRWISAEPDRFDGGFADTARFQALSLVAQPFALLAAASNVFIYLWVYRLTACARALGLPARREPGIVVLSFFIPIVSIWWPYQSICDALPSGHEGRRLVLRWWLLFLISPMTSFGLVLTGFLPILAWPILAVLATALAAAAVMTGRRVAAMIVEVHGQLLAERRLEATVAGA